MITFTVPGQPRGNQRVGTNRHTGAKYLPAQSQKYQDQIAWCLRKAVGAGPFKPSKRPFRVDISAYYQIPESWPRWKQKAAKDGDIMPTVKPDSDNIAKAVYDALNQVCYVDDAQIVIGPTLKFYSNQPRLVISVEALNLLPSNCSRADHIAFKMLQVDLLG